MTRFVWHLIKKFDHYLLYNILEELFICLSRNLWLCLKKGKKSEYGKRKHGKAENW